MEDTSATSTEAFDVSQFEIADTAVLVVKNSKLDDDLIVSGKKVTIELYSPGSPQGVKALQKASRSAQLRLYRAMRGEMNQRDAEDAERENAEKLTAFTKAINNFPVSGGAHAVYSNPRLGYISKQVEEFISKYASFSKGSSPS